MVVLVKRFFILVKKVAWIVGLTTHKELIRSYTFFYKQLDFSSESGVNEMLKEPESCLFYIWFLHDLAKICCLERKRSN